MRHRRRALASILLAGTFVLAGCSVCSNDKIAEAASPTGDYIASSYIRNCGATTDYVTLVYLRYKTDEDDRADENLVLTVARQRGGVTLAWKDNETLIVTCHCRPESVRQAVSARWSIRILFRTPSGEVLLPV